MFGLQAQDHCLKKYVMCSVYCLFVMYSYSFVIRVSVFRGVMDQRREIVVAGHSYVRRLRDHCRASDAERNLGFSTNSYRVSWCGVGGATVTRYGDGAAETRFRGELFGMESQADVIFIHIGENDVLQGVKAAHVVEHIHRLVIALEASNRVIFVGQLLPFPALHSRRHVVLFPFSIKQTKRCC